MFICDLRNSIVKVVSGLTTIAVKGRERKDTLRKRNQSNETVQQWGNVNAARRQLFNETL